jgi:hypothetical protein
MRADTAADTAAAARSAEGTGTDAAAGTDAGGSCAPSSNAWTRILTAIDELRGVAKRQREEIEKARADVAAALRKVHEALTGEQRRQLADLLERGPRGLGADFAGRWGGPYRGPQAWI